MNKCSKQVKLVPSNDPIITMEPRYAWWPTAGARAMVGKGKVWGRRNGRVGLLGTLTCTPLLPVLLGGETSQEWRSDASPEKKQDIGVNFCLCFSPFNSILIGTKLLFHNLSQFCQWQGLVSGLPVSISTYKIFLVIFSPSCLGEGGRRWLGSWLAAGNGQTTI